MKKLDLTGQTFGRWVVTGSSEKAKCWKCVCECGTERDVDGQNLKSGKSTSCGCFRSEVNLAKIKQACTIHGMEGTRPYRIWKSMRNRCYNVKHDSYPYYGGRGISVCDRWMIFKDFWEDMSEGYSDELTIDRIDVNGNYEPNNCQWATRSYQQRMKRTPKNNQTGVKGVSVEYKRGVKVYRSQQRDEKGNLFRKSFSSSKYGDEEAFRLACEFRELDTIPIPTEETM